MALNLFARSTRLVLLGAVLCGVALTAGRSPGQSPASNGPASSSGSATAVVDLVRIFNETAQIRDLNDEIVKKNDDYAKEAKQRKKSIEDRQMELTAFKVGSPDYEGRRKNLIRMNIEANVWLKVSEQEVDQMRYDWTKVVYEKAIAVASAIAKERGFSLVLQKTEWKPEEVDREQNLQNLRRVIQDRIVLYHAADIDITDTVVQRMDREYKAAGGKATLGTTTRPAGP